MRGRTLIRYLAALMTATLAGLAGVWLVLAPAALGYPGRGVYTSVPSRVSLYTGAGLGAVAVLTAVCWSVAWRRRLRADGVLPGGRAAPPPVPPEEAATGPLTPIPAAVPVRLEDDSLQALLAPLVSALTRDEPGERAGSPDAGREHGAPGRDAVPSPGRAGEAEETRATADAGDTADGRTPAGAVRPGWPDEPVGATAVRVGGAGGGLVQADVTVGRGAAGGYGPGAVRTATPFGAGDVRPPLPRRRPKRLAAGFTDDDAEETW